jgi:hypothetical protein
VSPDSGAVIDSTLFVSSEPDNLLSPVPRLCWTWWGVLNMCLQFRMNETEGVALFIEKM